MNLIKHSLHTRLAIFDDDKFSWNELEQELLLQYDCLIAFRGAGSRNGLDKEDADNLIKTELIPRITNLVSEGKKLVLLYDGDPDIPAKPDIGYVLGRLLDRFGNKDSTIFITVQREKWYKPANKGRNLTNANDQDFITYVFKQGVYDGEYSAFTQSNRLINSPKYQQWYIGASGVRADSQLQSYISQVPNGQKGMVIIFRAKINQNLNKYFQNEFYKATVEQNSRLISIYQEIINFRSKHPYGIHWDKDGNISDILKNISSLNIEFVML